MADSRLILFLAAASLGGACRSEKIIEPEPKPGPPPLVSPLRPIVFSSLRDTTHARFHLQIVAVKKDGSDPADLSGNAFNDTDPSWSADGQYIAFASDRGGGYDIYVMRGDGSSVRRLTSDPIDDRFPRWSPDGTKLIFESGRDGLLTAPLSTRRHSDLFVIDADGSHVTNNIRIVFSERMNEGSLSTRVFDLNSPFAGDFVQPSSSAYDTTTNTQTITVKLMSRHVYEVVVGPNFPAKDLAGNELLGSNRFRFTTLDAGPPGAVGFSPDRNAVDVDPATSIRVSFNEALDPATVNATNFTVYRTDGSGTISGSLSYDPATFSVVYKPDQLLQSGKQYGVVVQRLRDATGVDQEGVINYVFTVR